MEDNSRRRFTLVDAMILIAAIAVGFAWIRLSFLCCFDGRSHMAGDCRADTIRKYIMDYMEGMMPLLISLMAGVVVLRFRPPRPPIRDLFQQPGFAACFSSLILFILGYLRLLVTAYLSDLITAGSAIPFGRFPLPLLELTSCTFLIPSIAYVILAQWISLALSGRWKPQSSWVDRLGIFLGAVWLLYLLVPGMH